MAMRPVSFLAQAAAQRQQTRESEKQRDFQKDQALRDFGMNIGQALVGSLANFGAQAGAQAIAFNREEPYKQLEANVNPMPGLMPKIGGAPSALKVPAPVAPPSAALEQAALARTAATPPTTELPGRQAPTRPPLPAPTAMAGALGGAVSKAIAPRPPVPGTIAAGVGKARPSPAQDEIASAFDAPGQPPAPPARVAPPMRRPAPAMPPRGAEMASPRSGREMEIAAAPPASAPMSVMGALKQVGRGLTAPAAPPPSASPTPARGSVIKSMSRSSSGPVNPEAQSWAQQEMRQIIQKHLGPPMEYTNADGSPADPQDAAFRRAYDQKADNARLDMLVKMGLVDAEDMKAEAYRIKSLMEGNAADRKATAYERDKAMLAWKNAGSGAKSVTQNYDKGGRLLSGAPREFVVTNDPNAPMWPSVESVPDPKAPRRGGGGGGGGNANRGIVADAVPLARYSEGKGGLPKALGVKQVPLTAEALTEVATLGVGGSPAFPGTKEADRKKILELVAQAESAATPEAKKALLQEAGQFAFDVQQKALPEFAQMFEARSTSTKDIKTAEKVELKATEAEGAKVENELLASNTKREKAVTNAKAKMEESKRALTLVDIGVIPALKTTGSGVYELGPNKVKVTGPNAARAMQAAQAADGKAPVDPGAKIVYDKAKRVLKERDEAARTAIAPFRSEYVEGGGHLDDFDNIVLPQPTAAPGPSTPSPGQPPPPPGTQSSLDDLFDQIEAKPWDAAKKRRVFRDMAQKAGLA